MPYVPRTEATLAMFKAQPAILRDPNSEKEDRISAFYCLMTMEWATNKAITMDDVDMTPTELNDLSIQNNPEFREAKNRFVADMLKGEQEK